MTAIAPFPDIEKALVQALKLDPNVIGTATAARVSTELPSTFDSTKGEKRIQLFSIPGTPVVRRAVYRPLIQINAFGTKKSEAFAVASAAHSAMLSLEGKSLPEAIIYEVEEVVEPYWSPDPETDVARYLMRFGVVTRSR